jgi:hypothetical protein
MNLQQDVLALCGGTLPAWCPQLVTGARFLFPFELRRRWFYCTAFGMSRTLNYLQISHAAEGDTDADRGGRETRAGRLTRQKVWTLALCAGFGAVECMGGWRLWDAYLWSRLG